MRSAVAVLVAASTVALTRSVVARAERYVVQRGETLEHVAADARLHDRGRAAREPRDNTLVAARHGRRGARLPAASLAEQPVARRDPPPSDSAGDSGEDDDEKAREALAVIDGATWVDRPSKVTEVADDEPSSESGDPWNGTLEHGEPLPQGDGYVVRRPNRAYGATHVIDHLQDAIAEVRARLPRLHTLAIGDLSRRGGGRLAGHVSHQTGLDVDVGFYFTTVPAGYPDSFHVADDTLDAARDVGAAERVRAHRERDHRRAADLPRLRRAGAPLQVRARRTARPQRELDRVFQYPRGKDEQAGIVRHWPHHADHMHVRFKPGR